MLSEETRSTLLDAGWQQGRTVDVSKYEAAYAAKGYPVQESALRFLREFGGLSLTYPHIRDKGAIDGCNFRADEACAWDRAWLQDYEKHIGQTLVPLGHAFSDHMLLVMAGDGSVFACFEDTVCRVGSSGEEALNALCEGHELDCSEIDECDDVAVAADLIDSVRERLMLAGWSSGRSIDVTPEAAALHELGFVMTDEARRFLQEFGGLRIRTEVGGELEVSSTTAMTMLGGVQSEICSRLNAQGITPIGVANPGSITVIMDDQGRLFGTIPEVPGWLVKYGDSRVAGLNAIVSGVGAISVG